MVVRGPGQNPAIRPAGPGAGGGQPAPANPTPGDAAQRLGVFRPGMDQAGTLKSLLNFFMMAGFMPKMDARGAGTGGDDAAKLAEALKNLQGKEGLPQTGKLDEKTLKAAEKYKPAQGTGERATERQAASQMQQQTSRAATGFRDQALAAWIKNKAAELQKPATAQPPATPNPPAPSTSTSQAAHQPPQAARADGQPAQNTPPTQQKDSPTHNPAVRSDDAARADARATRESGASQAHQPGQGQGQGQGQPGGDAGGRIKQKGQGTGSAADLPGGKSTGEMGGTEGHADDMTAFEDGRGNQASGDEDEEDERRGAALVDDGSGVDEGAYRIPSIREQFRDALAALTVEASTDRNRTTTYTGEFKFYRPGTYQSATQAPMLLNLKVVNATAYDEVWSRCLEQINVRLKTFEPDTPPATVADISSALAVARARSGS